MSDGSTDDLTCLRFRIEGHVQAVGYRNFVMSEAPPPRRPRLCA